MFERGVLYVTRRRLVDDGLEIFFFGEGFREEIGVYLVMDCYVKKSGLDGSSAVARSRAVRLGSNSGEGADSPGEEADFEGMGMVGVD